jgi:hypothetical protein
MIRLCHSSVPSRRLVSRLRASGSRIADRSVPAIPAEWSSDCGSVNLVPLRPLVRADLDLAALPIGGVSDIDGRQPALPRLFPVQATPRPGYAASPPVSALASIVNSDTYASIAAAGMSRTRPSVTVCNLPDLMSSYSWLRLRPNSTTASSTRGTTRAAELPGQLTSEPRARLLPMLRLATSAHS